MQACRSAPVDAAMREFVVGGQDQRRVERVHHRVARFDAERHGQAMRERAPVERGDVTRRPGEQPAAAGQRLQQVLSGKHGVAALHFVETAARQPAHHDHRDETLQHVIERQADAGGLQHLDRIERRRT
jgi:alpha-D-ribose 1-methylphosphonate 5-triphosphate synthase subunit PhnI